MAYEKEAMAPATSAIPSDSPPIMREERVIDPKTYDRAPQRPVTPLNNGQPAKSVDGLPPEPKATEETLTLSPQVAALARKEQKARQQEAELKKRELALDADRKEIEELKALKAKLANKDYSGIESLVDYEGYSNYLIEKSGSITPEQQELKALREDVAKIKNSAEENVTKQFEAAVAQRKTAAAQLLETSTEFPRLKKLETLHKGKGQEAIVQHILDTWEHDSEEISVEQAAKEVQMVLEQTAKKWASILEEDAPKVEDKKTLPPLKPAIKTLTNNMTATGEIKKPQKSYEFMSDSERYAEARRRAVEKLSLNSR